MPSKRRSAANRPNVTGFRRIESMTARQWRQLEMLRYLVLDCQNSEALTENQGKTILDVVNSAERGTAKQDREREDSRRFPITQREREGLRPAIGQR